MSMTVYPVTGAALTLNASDIRAASGTFTNSSGGYPATPGQGGAIEVSQDRTITKNGVTRVMVKCSAKTPFTPPGSASPTELGTISAHLVLTVPRAVSEQMQMEAAGAATKDTTQTLIWVLAVLTALINNKSLAALPTLATSLPLVQGVIGALPLNTSSGSYGSAS